MTTLQKKNLNMWMNRFVAWLIIFELTVAVGESVTFVNNELPPHNVMFDEPYQEMSHSDLAFTAGETFDVVFDTAGDWCWYEGGDSR